MSIKRNVNELKLKNVLEASFYLMYQNEEEKIIEINKFLKIK